MTTANSFDAANIGWSTPLEIAAQGVSVWDKIRIYRSPHENQGYALISDAYGMVISEIDSQASGSWIVSWDDTTVSMMSKDGFYYLVRYYNSIAMNESKFYLAWKSLTPKEQRMVDQVKGIITPWISQFCSDDDIRAGIILAMNAINMYPPVTGFSLDNFPDRLEPFLLTGAVMFALMFRYLGVAITDLNYSDMGFSLNIDRGSKVKIAIDTLLGYYKDMLP
jgi:hypothetical protein